MNNIVKRGVIISLVLLTVAVFGWSEHRLSSISIIVSDNVEALTDPTNGNDPIMIDGQLIAWETSDNRLLLEQKKNIYGKFGKLRVGCESGDGTCDTFAWKDNSDTSASDWGTWISNIVQIGSQLYEIWSTLKGE